MPTLQYHSQEKAQAKVKALIKQGVDPSEIMTVFLPGGTYVIEWGN